MKRTIINALGILGAAALLELVAAACQHSPASSSTAMAGAGSGAAGGTSAGGPCSCTPEKWTTIVEQCKPADATHNSSYIEHDFPGVPAAQLARIVAVSNWNTPEFFDYKSATAVLLVADGKVGGVCGGDGASSFTLVVPQF